MKNSGTCQICCVCASKAIEAAMQLDMCEYGRKWEIFGSH